MHSPFSEREGSVIISELPRFSHGEGNAPRRGNPLEMCSMGKSVLLFLVLVTLMLGACAKTPKEELRLAREAVSQAAAAGASKLAPDDYEEARTALQNAESLIQYRNYRLARKVLPMAASLGYRATFLAREERVRLEAIQKEEEERRRQKALAEEEESRQPEVLPKEPLKTEAAKEKEPAPPPMPSRFKVKGEETLWGIASLKEIYDDPLLWPLIYKANSDQIRDPRQIHPGQVLAIPRTASPEDLEDARNEARQSNFFSTERSALSN